MLGLQRFVTVTQLFRRATVYSSAVRGRTILAAPSPNQTQDTTTASTGNNSSSNATKDNHSAETHAETAVDSNYRRPKNSIVAAAFRSLADQSNGDSSSSSSAGQVRSAAEAAIDERINAAKTVNGLLVVAEPKNGSAGGTINRRQALKIVSILAEWSSMKRVKTAEFENDTRFLRICRMLGRTVAKQGQGANAADNGSVSRISGFRTDDLNTVLGVAGDDEAAKLIASISLPQMVKVMSALAARKRRSTPLLRSLAFNISADTERLDLKQCADVLYAMATLSFQDSVLSAKICADIQEGLPKNTEKSAVVGSILTSLGILKYRDLDMMESLTAWMLQHSDICRPQDVSALFYTSAVLCFRSSRLEDIRTRLVRAIVREDFPRPLDWLNHIWALSLLNLVSDAHLASVLRPEFTKELATTGTGGAGNGLTPTAKMRLLNLNASARLLRDGAVAYAGPLLADDSEVFNVPMAHGKGKQGLLNGMLDALKSLMPATSHVQSLVDSKMGFLIDALCLFDSKRNPLPVEKEQDAIKVALMVVDFHDVCQGPHRTASGLTKLTFDLLEKSGYRVIPIPYNEFNVSDKLLKRVQYLEGQFKATIIGGPDKGIKSSSASGSAASSAAASEKTNN